MRSYIVVTGVVVRTVLIALTLIVPAVAYAQDAEPARVTIRLLDVTPAMQAQFEAAIGERTRVVESAGWPYMHVYQTVRGRSLPSYVVITPDGAYADLPDAENAEGWIERAQATLSGNDLMSVAFLPELSIYPETVPAPSGQFMRVRVRTTSPANRQAYIAFRESEFTPALRQAGVTDIRGARVTAGGNLNTFIHLSYSDDWAAGGGVDLGAAVGQEETARLFQRLNELTAVAEDFVLSYRPDLSFTAE